MGRSCRGEASRPTSLRRRRRLYKHRHLACSVEEFRAKSEVIADTLGMHVIDVDEAEPLAERTSKYEITEELADMIRRAEPNPNAIIYGAFHLYPFDEA